MKKVISTRDFAAIKKMAQIVNPLVSQKATKLKKIAELREEIEGPSGLDVQINGMEAGIKAKFLGMGTEQLIKKVVSPAVRPDGTPVLDAKTGKQLTKTTWEPTSILSYDAEKNVYILTVEEEETTAAPEEEETVSYSESQEEEEAKDFFAQQEADTEQKMDENPFGF